MKRQYANFVGAVWINAAVPSTGAPRCRDIRNMAVKRACGYSGYVSVHGRIAFRPNEEGPYCNGPAFTAAL